jgi:hypothetical protein
MVRARSTLKPVGARSNAVQRQIHKQNSLQRRTMVPVTNGSVVVIDNVHALYRLGEVDHEVQQLTAATPSSAPAMLRRRHTTSLVRYSERQRSGKSGYARGKTME